MLFSLAWKNIWRNKRRSLIIISAIAAGLLCGLLASAVMFGMADSFVNSTIDRDLGHIQIHSGRYEDDHHISDYIQKPDEIIGSVKKTDNIRGMSSRVLIEGMVSSASSSGGVRIVGINPEEERNVTNIYRQLLSGNYLEGGNPDQSHRMKGILIGKKLADKLAIRERSKIVLSFQGLDGSIIYGAFRVTGIFSTESSDFDKSTVFITQKDIFSLLNSEPVYHEIVIRLASVKHVDSAYARLKSELNEVSVKNWKELAPELKLMDEMTGMQLSIFLGIILFALLFGITNTMLMSVMERVREFGMLIAIGMKRLRIFIMIMLESISLSFVGGIIGITLAKILIGYLEGIGIDLTAFTEGFKEWNLSPVLQPVLPLDFYIIITIMTLVTAILSAVYPAFKAIKLKPAEAIRTY